MPSCQSDETPEFPIFNPPARFALSAFDRACIKRLIGHTLARIERELILQSLRYYRGNRTRTADRLGISIRSLRDKIRNYRDQGESVPDPENGAMHN